MSATHQPQVTLTPEERAARIRLFGDFPLFAAKCLKIKTKAGKIIPFQLNFAQRYAHAQIEEQKKRTGRVRALVCKSRQQGFSTYIEGRMYWKVSNLMNRQAYILTHRQDATDNLFAMVERFYELSPPALRPRKGKSNAKELRFPRTGSGYAVGTAGTVAIGRSMTTQYFHGSEAAFWTNAEDHFAGILETVPEENGTEIILETTGNGPTGAFYERWQSAVAGESEYLPIFVPWFWTPEYRRPCDPDFALSKEEQEVAELHKLDHEQMNWRRNKIQNLKDEMLFMQEYPATPSEAFQATGTDSFINGNLVYKARKANLEGIGPLILGVDPKREGDDRFVVAGRRGRKAELYFSSREPIDTLTAASKVKGLIDALKPEKVFIDVGGNGGGIFDVLVSWGRPYVDICKVVNFGASPLQPWIWLPDPDGKGKPTHRPGPKNRRAEMWLASRDWLSQEGGADIPDTEGLQADATGPGYGYDLEQRLVLESKERMAARGVKSPDEWDAIALTFAEPVSEGKRMPRDRPAPRADGWMGG